MASSLISRDALEKVRLGLMCCFGVDGKSCKGCPYYQAAALEEMTCDMDLVRDALALIGAQDTERSDAQE